MPYCSPGVKIYYRRQGGATYIVNESRLSTDEQKGIRTRKNTMHLFRAFFFFAVSYVASRLTIQLSDVVWMLTMCLLSRRRTMESWAPRINKLAESAFARAIACSSVFTTASR